MKLLIKKDQDAKIFGGVKFKLEARTELDTIESALIEKYKVHKEVLLIKNGTFINTDITIKSLIDGVVFKSSTIQEILKYENNVKKACRTFNNLINVMESFGGEYEINCEVDKESI